MSTRSLRTFHSTNFWIIKIGRTNGYNPIVEMLDVRQRLYTIGLLQSVQNSREIFKYSMFLKFNIFINIIIYMLEIFVALKLNLAVVSGTLDLTNRILLLDVFLSLSLSVILFILTIDRFV